MSDQQLLHVMIAGASVQLQEGATVVIDYELEDPDNFQNKQSSAAYDVDVPATPEMDEQLGGFHDPDREDLTPGEATRAPQPASISLGSLEIFRGLALLKSATHTDRPEGYRFNIYGQNGDWLLKMQDLTLWDCLHGQPHTFTKANIEASWLNNGTSNLGDFVYAPVRYRRKFGGVDGDDSNVGIMDMRPSLFLYWFIRRAFDSIGYTIKSDFMDSDYFRRLAMLWTWGDFLRINSSQADLLKFKATGNAIDYSSGPNVITSSNGFYASSPNGFSSNTNSGEYVKSVDLSSFWNAAPYTMGNTLQPLGFENMEVYNYHGDGDPFNGAMEWNYPASMGNVFGTITARFELGISASLLATNGSNISLYAEVYKSGALQYTTLLFTAAANAGNTNGVTDEALSEYGRYFSFVVNGVQPGDNVVVRLRYQWFKSALGSCRIYVYSNFAQSVIGSPGTYKTYRTYFLLSGISIEPGSVVNLKQYEVFKKYKFLDLLRGVLDFFNISPATDSIAREVTMEPLYPYSTSPTSGQRTGLYNGQVLDMTEKQDLEQVSQVENFADSAREAFFSFQEDTRDGGLNKFIGRYATKPGAAKYIFPDRFKDGTQEYQNRFFSPLMHYNATQWKAIAGIAPQLPVLIPENISNTSNSENEADFAPKLAFYKGLTNRFAVGGWRWDGDTTRDLPFLFAVNYNPGGHNDPILAYDDQNINNVLGRGLLYRFFLARLAVLRIGRRYNTWLKLDASDVTNWLHREGLKIGRNEYRLVKIDGFDPIGEESTKITAWRYGPPEQKDEDAIRPSFGSVMGFPQVVSSPDIRYQRLLLFPSDLP